MEDKEMKRPFKQHHQEKDNTPWMEYSNNLANSQTKLYGDNTNKYTRKNIYKTTEEKLQITLEDTQHGVRRGRRIQELTNLIKQLAKNEKEKRNQGIV